MKSLNVVLDNLVAAGDAAGATACALTSNGLQYLGASGARDRETDSEMTPDTLFYIASMTKAITSLAALQCVDAGLLELYAPITSVLPSLDAAPVLKGYDNNGEAILQPSTQPITLRHLLTHTSGLAYTTWNPELFEYRQRHPQARPIAGPTLRLSAPLVSEPGQRWQYSTSTDFVGLAVEAVSGMRLGDYFAKHIFTPLAMHNSFYVPPASHRARIAIRYQRLNDGTLQPEPSPMFDENALHGGGGGLYSTAEDYAKFLQALLQMETTSEASPEQLLTPATWRKMRTNQIGSLIAGGLPSSEPQRSHSVHFMSDHAPGFSYGLLVNARAVADARGAHGLAWAGLYNSYFWLDPRRNQAGALFTQVLPFADPRILLRFKQFEHAVYAAFG